MGRDWKDDLQDEIQAEIDEMADAVRGVFKETHKPKRTPSKKERLTRFLSMTRPQRQELFANMGPEQFGTFIQENIQLANELLGPEAARDLLAYMYADGTPAEETDPKDEAMQYLDMLTEGGGSNEAILEEAVNAEVEK